MRRGGAYVHAWAVRASPGETSLQRASPGKMKDSPERKLVRGGLACGVTRARDRCTLLLEFRRRVVGGGVFVGGTRVGTVSVLVGEALNRSKSDRSESGGSSTPWRFEVDGLDLD